MTGFEEYMQDVMML